MGGCRCSYKSCRSATKTTENLHFFHYPVKHRDRCGIWIRNADKPEFADLPNFQLRNKVICGLHFEDKYFANVEKRRLVHNAVPTLDAGCDSTSDDLSYIKEVEILPTSNDGSTYTLTLDDLQSSATKKPRIDYGNGASINLPEVTKVEPDVYTIDPAYFNQSFYNNDNIKEVVINSAEALADNVRSIKEEEHIDDEDCMLYEAAHSHTAKQPVKHTYPAQTENKLQTLFFDHDDIDTPQHVQIQDSKGNIMLTDLSTSTSAPTKLAKLKSANGTTTMIKKIKLAPNQPISISTPNASGHVIKRTVFKRVISAEKLLATQKSPPLVAIPKPVMPAPIAPKAAVAASTALLSPVTAGTIKQATNTIRLTNKNLLRCLKGRMPDSLLGAVSLHLNKRRNVVTVDEQEYDTMVATLPLAARVAMKDFGWYIPTNTYT